MLRKREKEKGKEKEKENNEKQEQKKKIILLKNVTIICSIDHQKIMKPSR